MRKRHNKASARTHIAQVPVSARNARFQFAMGGREVPRCKACQFLLFLAAQTRTIEKLVFPINVADIPRCLRRRWVANGMR